MTHPNLPVPLWLFLLLVVAVVCAIGLTIAMLAAGERIDLMLADVTPDDDLMAVADAVQDDEAQR